MSQINDNRIIAPPIEEEVYPYRRVWRSIVIQVTILVIVSSSVVFAGEILGFQFDASLNIILSVVLVCIPLILWLTFSVLTENFVPEPRTDLITVAVISGLAAAAIGIPLVQDFFQVDRWLPLESAFQRILGLMFTVGIVDTGLKFVIIRYIFFPRLLRIRTDAIAYCVASAIGYSFVVNLFLVINTQSILSISMIYVLSNFTVQLASSMFLAYGFSETYFVNPIPIVLPISILLSAFVTGFISPFVSGLMSGALTTSGNADRPLFSLGFLIAMLLGSIALTYFLYSVAERREREAFASSE